MTRVFCTSTSTPIAGSTRESASTARTEWKNVAPPPPSLSDWVTLGDEPDLPDEAFADSYQRQDVEKYKATVTAMARTLFDRDTAPGAEPEDLLQLEIPALIVPGRDPSHATSAARYLEECLPKSEYWDVPVAGQTEETVPPRLLDFLGKL